VGLSNVGLSIIPRINNVIIEKPTFRALVPLTEDNEAKSRGEGVRWVWLSSVLGIDACIRLLPF
jgi:hypothetical protein